MQVLQPHFAVLDIETTGFSPTKDRIVEIAIVRLDINGVFVDEWVTRVNPDRPVGATHVHGITQADVIDKPRFAEIAGEIARRLNKTVVVAHNASFDVGFLKEEFDAAGWEFPQIPVFCTLDWSYQYYPQQPRHRLEDCCNYHGVELVGAHSALGDAQATAKLLVRFMINAQLLGKDVPRPEWPSGPAREPKLREPYVFRGRALDPYVQARIAANATKQKPESGTLRSQISLLSLRDVTDENSSNGLVNYLETLLTVLDDGIVTDAEAEALEDLRAALDISVEEATMAHESLIVEIAKHAVADGTITKKERDELKLLTELLGSPASFVVKALKAAEIAHFKNKSKDLADLPDAWQFGEPVRVGDQVVFTGGETSVRDVLEEKSVEVGVIVGSGVSSKTRLLVSDGEFQGGKFRAAQEKGIRTVTYETYSELIKYVQPWITR